MKILHTGDLHLGAAFSSLSADKAAQRKSNQRELFARILKAAAAEHCEVLLFAGDLFDIPNPDPEIVKFVQRGFASYPGTVILEAGNHDYYTPTGPYALPTWSSNVKIFQSPTLTKIELPCGITVWGASYIAPDMNESPLKSIGSLPVSSNLQVLMLHGELNGLDHRYACFTTEELSASGADYAALAHIHQPTELKCTGNTFFSYCGTPEGRGFDETESVYPFGITICSLEKGNIQIKRIPVASYHYYRCDLHLSASDDPSVSVSSLLTGPSDSYSIRMSGRVNTTPDLSRILRENSNKVFSLELTDETTLSQDLWSDCGDPTIRGKALEKLAAYKHLDPALADLSAEILLSVLDDRPMPEEDCL